MTATVLLSCISASISESTTEAKLHVAVLHPQPQMIKKDLKSSLEKSIRLESRIDIANHG